MCPARLGRYEVLYEIGDGSMGRVYKAWDPVLSRIVAAKAVKSEYLTHSTATDYLRRFRREAQAAGRLSHPAIVRVFDVGFDYMVMELVEGRTLQELLRDHGRFEPSEVVALLSPVADAIDYAHRTGVIHRDIKPGNIIVQPGGQPKLMDFGVAHLATSVMTTAGEILGSPSYMSPEQIAGFEVTASADIYALAVVAYEMLTGEPPFQGAITQVIYRVMHEVPAAPRRCNPGLPHRYDDLFAQALDKQVARRFATAGEFVGALALRELDLLAPAAGAQRLAAPQEPPSSLTLPVSAIASGGGRGWYEHVETVASRPGGARRRPLFPRGRVRPMTVAGSSLVVILTTAAAVLSGTTQTVVRAATAVPTVARPATPARPTAPARVLPPARRTTRTASLLRPRPRVEAQARPYPPSLPTPTPVPPTPAPQQVFVAATPAPTLPGSLPSLQPRSLDPGPEVTPPRRIAGTTVYPRLTGRDRGNGTVAIEMVVDEEGRPRDLNVVVSAGPALDAAALDSVRSWRFEPARQNGVPVKVRWLARQTYQLTP
ncbi:MAG TPA: TonB family protein [Vicinamibacteria bacterium]|nr:TonB family protein [Vicinamibacteria bacterium]